MSNKQIAVKISYSRCCSVRLCKKFFVVAYSPDGIIDEYTLLFCVVYIYVDVDVFSEHLAIMELGIFEEFVSISKGFAPAQKFSRYGINAIKLTTVLISLTVLEWNFNRYYDTT
jgi:hypothetical protein